MLRNSEEVKFVSLLTDECGHHCGVKEGVAGHCPTCHIATQRFGAPGCDEVDERAWGVDLVQIIDARRPRDETIDRSQRTKVMIFK